MIFRKAAGIVAAAKAVAEAERKQLSAASAERRIARRREAPDRPKFYHSYFLGFAVI